MLLARRREDVLLEDEVVARVVDRAVARADLGAGRPMAEVVNDALHHERARLLNARGDDERAAADGAFHDRVRHELPHVGHDRQRALLREIVERYVVEITGHFDPRVYRFATGVLPYGLSALMQSFSARGLLAELRGAARLDEHLLLEGNVAALGALVRRGTVVLVPTHSSNLDSPLIGYAIYRMGLPHFVYGAGLNLFTSPLTSFFMHNLGAYTIDRGKTDPLYRETLKEYATVSLELGQHNLFFPGGTRSRSGEAESRIKLGLLGAGLVAYRNNLLRGKVERSRIFIVPCTITHPLVLEAATLVREFLECTCKSSYITVDDESGRLQRWVHFLRGVAQLDLRVHVRIGQALDPFGNDVDDEGTSRDPRGRPVDPRRYLLRDGRVVEDAARDAEYTRMLAERVVAAYRQDTVALPTSVLAFALVEVFRGDIDQPELCRFLRTIGPATPLSMARVEAKVAELLVELRAREQAGEIRLSDDVRAADGAEVVRRGLASLRTYHKTPVLAQRGDALVVLDAELLFFYRNRLEGYGLLGASRLYPARGLR